MATLVFSAIGNAVAGPIGGALGALVGNQIDRAIFGTPSREGPRLKEVGVSTSTYGAAIPRHFGIIRAPGSIIWATDLVESSETTGGGKNSPSVTTYSYSCSFAVALSSRPILGIGRIWADGNLLRGSAGDLKTGGQFRLYAGHADQQPDPTIFAAKGGNTPAFRDLAYCVFESLQLADFGNRIPALSFEIISDTGGVDIVELLAPIEVATNVDLPLSGLAGYSDEGGGLGDNLAVISQVYPVACDASGDALTLTSAISVPTAPPILPPAVVDHSEGAFGRELGARTRIEADARNLPGGLRYYDTGRDYLSGLQRADGRARPGRQQIIEFPAALDAGTARQLVSEAAERASWSREQVHWRVGELDPALAPGSIVRLPGKAGNWRVDEWEWRETGIELQLERLPLGPARVTPADSGTALAPIDIEATPTQLLAIEMPWDGNGSPEERIVYAAASSSSAGWTGAALYSEIGGELGFIGATGSRRSITGSLATALPPGAIHRLDSLAWFEVDLVPTDLPLAGASAEQLATGANRAAIGDEIVQFSDATSMGGGRWRLTGLLRGRGGTEGAAMLAHPAGTPFALLDDRPVKVDAAQLGSAEAIAAIGLVDPDPVVSAIIGSGRGPAPLAPVHPVAVTASDNSLQLSWTRRARGGWLWRDGVDTPLNEEREAYLVGLGSIDTPVLVWEAQQPGLTLDPAVHAQLQAVHPGKMLWVRQIGTASSSPATLLTTIA